MRRSASAPVAITGTIVGALASAVAVLSCHRAPGPAAVAEADAGGAAEAPSAAPTAPPNALPFPSASVAAVVNPRDLPRYEGPTGSVEGTVLVRGPDAPDVPVLAAGTCPGVLDAYRKLFRAGPARPDGARPLADAVVVLTDYSPGFYIPARDEAVKVTIGADCTYPLHTYVLTFGQRLEIANASTVPFAPFLEGSENYAVMIAPPLQRGQPVRIYPPRADHFSLKDRMQPFVRGDVYVLRQPLHAVSDTAGHFRIDGVPVGKLKVGARSAAIDATAQKDVSVRTNVVENVELILDYTPKPPLPFQGPVRKRTDPGGQLNPND